MFNLAGIFWEGRGTQQDFSRAVHWWQQAATHDDSASQYNLGLAYFLGQGVTSNPAQAIAWLQKANRNGYPKAQSALELVKDALSETSQNAIVSRDTESVVSPGSANTVPTETNDLVEATTATTITPTGTGDIVSPRMPQAEKLAPTASETPQDGIVSRDTESVVSPDSANTLPTQTNDLAEAATASTITPTGTGDIVSPRMPQAEKLAPTAITAPSDSDNDAPTTTDAETPAGVTSLTVSENGTPPSVPPDSITATAPTETSKVPAPPVTVEETSFTRVAQATSAQAAIITGEAVQAYASRAGLLPVLGTLAPDTPIKILSVTDEWTQVLIPGGIDVWVFDQFIAEDDQGARIQGEGVRARSVPSTGADSKVIGYFSHGDTVTVQSVQGQWKLVTPSAIPLAVWIMSEHVQPLETASPAWLSAWAPPVTVEETSFTRVAQATSAQAAIITGEAVQAYASRAGLLPVLGTLAPDTPIKILSVTDEGTRS
ncbi:MAG: hypothetical protein CM1200mP41_13500 [Gammaproteobacteria bacterium]|nr:MAG: hypothetical protein CM1200mP41_13500 [Gammaproteobacteria bacterium]